jgi:hypothetical protein
MKNTKQKWSLTKSYFLGPLRHFKKRLGYSFFGSRYKFSSESHPLGVDEFGRDVKLGLQHYLKLLNTRDVEVRSLVVHGSRTKGAWSPKSDIDVLVITNDTPPSKKLLSDNPLYLGVEAVSCSAKDFMHWIRECRLVVLDAMYFGQVIFDDGFWVEARMAFLQIEKEYNISRDDLLKKLATI